MSDNNYIMIISLLWWLMLSISDNIMSDVNMLQISYQRRYH